MALNFDFNSLNFGGNDQASNPMMRPVDLDQLDFSQPPSSFGTPNPFQPPARSADPQSRILEFGQGILDLLGRAGEVVSVPTTALGQLGNAAIDYLGNPSRPSFDQAYSDARAELPFFDQASIDAEETRSLNEYEDYCRDRYGNVTNEQCAFLDEQESISEAIARGGPGAQFIDTQGTNPMLDYRAPILGQQDFSSDLSAAEASFVLPNGEVRTIMPGQDVASAFGRERGTRTFPIDEGSVTVPSELLAETMGLTPSLQDIQNVQPPEVAPDDTFVPDGRSSFFTESAAREQRLRDRDRQPGETRTERDTRIAKSRQQQRSSSDMTFAEASKFVPRKESYSGRKESKRIHTARIKEFQARYNSDPQKAARKAAELLNQGRIIDNNLVQAKLDNYKRTSAQKYSDVVEVAELLVTDGRLDENQAVLFIVDEMGGDIKKLFAEPDTPSGVSDSKTETPTLVDAITGRTPNASGFYSDEIEAGIRAVMDANGLSREAAIAALKDAGELPQ
tara:strand:- start:441 stop:1961 length:1521 start_codon:yes stop_codon:yes gene_type:complete